MMVSGGLFFETEKERNRVRNHARNSTADEAMGQKCLECSGGPSWAFCFPWE